VQVKKQAIYAVTNKLLREQETIRYKLRQNLGSFKSLAEEQARLKRELSVLGDLIRDLKQPAK
jgi:hypothetical protein